MTGLLMVVPRNQSGRGTEVLLPIPDVPHIAVIGFGIAENDTTLCNQPLEDGICYVNLDKWSLEPIGAGGAPSNVQPPRGLVNVTRGAGGGNVQFPSVDARSRRRITLLSGAAEQKPCSLGEWRYDPAGEGAAEVFPLVNVLYWDIQHQQNNPPKLTFKPKSASDTVKSLPLLSDGNNEVHVLIAHIPESEKGQLPPNEQSDLPTPPDTGATPAHFDHFYDLLHPTPQNRPLPSFVASTAVRPCPVKISTVIGNRFIDQPASLATYSCVMASGDEGS
jgi:hypothetical protein